MTKPCDGVEQADCAGALILGNNVAHQRFRHAFGQRLIQTIDRHQHPRRNRRAHSRKSEVDARIDNPSGDNDRLSSNLIAQSAQGDGREREDDVVEDKYEDHLPEVQAEIFGSQQQKRITAVAQREQRHCYD